MQEMTDRAFSHIPLDPRNPTLRGILDAVPGGVVWLATDGGVLYANAEAQRFADMQQEALEKTAMSDWRPRTVRPDGTPFEVHEYPGLKCLQTGEAQPATTMGIRQSNGEISWGLFTAIPHKHPQTGQTQGAILLFLDITERMAVEEKLRNSEQRFELLLSNTPNVAIEGFDEKGQLIYWNRAAEKIYGWTREEVLGKRCADLMLTPGECDAFEKQLQDLAAGRRAVAAEEWRFRRKDGTYGWNNSTVFPVPQGGKTHFFCMGIEITARRQVEEALKRSEASYRTLVEAAFEVIWSVDLTGRIIYINPAARRVYGYDPLEMIGRPYSDFTKPTDGERERESTAIIMAGGTVTDYEVEMRRPDGTYVHMLSNAGPLYDSNGAIIGATGTAVDVTARKKAEQERFDMERKMLEAQKLESLGVLAGGVAHDFNNLLQAVQGNVGLLRMQLPPTSPLVANLDSIDNTVQQASNLCRQMLAYAGRGKLVIEPVDLSVLIRDMSSLLGVTIGKNLQLVYELAIGLPRVPADSAQLGQVVMNLVLNAAEAMAENTGRIILRTGRMQFEETPGFRFRPDPKPGEYLFIEVVDRGCGMDPATLERVFDPFFTTKFTGRGLGMAAVMGIILRHDGFIGVRSAVGQGTSFRVLLPFKTNVQPLR